MIFALVLLAVFCAASVLLGYLNIVAAAAIHGYQRQLRNDVAYTINQLIDRVEGLTDDIDGSLDCLVAQDARLSELLGQEPNPTAEVHAE